MNDDAVLDPIFVNYLEVPDEVASLDPATIAANREEWINAWRELVLK